MEPDLSGSRPISVVKVGGAILDDVTHLQNLLAGIGMRAAEEAMVLVHGGGKQSTALARRLGHEPRMVHGRRVTTDLDLAIALWVMRGEINARLVAAAGAAGIRSAGVSGIDDRTIRVEKRPPWQIDGEMIDFGHVGDISEVDATLLQNLLDGGVMPIVASLGIDARGSIYNVNADTVAIHVAAALNAERLFFVAESGGLRRVVDDPSTHVAECSHRLFLEGVRDGWIADGMRVKLETGFEALDSGLREVYILTPSDLANPERGTRLILEADETPLDS